MPALLKIAGLHTLKNYLGGSTPEGGLQGADNIVIDRDNIAEPRRGFAKYGNDIPSASARAKQLFTYKNRILRHYENTMQFDSDGSGTFTSFTGTYTEPETGLRIKGVEVNGNFYFTTSTGIKKISVADASSLSADAVQSAGAPKALDLETSLDYSQTGFLSTLSKCAYRVVWGIRDNNNNLLRGSPSERAVVSNISTTDSAIVDLTFSVPSDVDSTKYFYQIYRSAVFQAASLTILDSLDPGDELYLVAEDFVTDPQIALGSVTFEDITPEDFRAGGALAYTNPVSGQGIEQANEKPPFAKDIALYKNHLFYANTETVHRLSLSLLSVQDMYDEKTFASGDVNDTTDVITIVGHGWPNGSIVYLNNSTTSNLPAGLSHNTRYYIVESTTDTFKLSETDGGSAVDITGTGSGTHVIRKSSFIRITDGTTTNRYVFRGYKETITVDLSGMTDPVDGTLDGLYFTLPSARSERIYKVWFDDTGTTTEPTASVDGTIAVRVDLSTTGSTSKADVAGDIQDALVAITDDFNITLNTDVLTIECADNGAVDNANVATDIASGFAISTDGNGDGEDTSSQEILLPAVPTASQNGPTVSQQVDSCARSLVRNINANASDVVNAFYLSGAEDVPGQLNIEERDNSGSEFFITADSSDTSENFTPSLGIEATGSAATGAGTVTITKVAHGLSNTNEIAIYDSETTPSIDGIYTISNKTDDTFDISATVTSAGSIKYALTTADSDNEVKPNRVYYSKLQEPDAVPLVNYLDIGPKDKAIKRILALRESLFVFKEDGIYRLTGEVAPNWFTTPFDSSAIILAPDSATVLNNKIYALTTQGVVSVTDTGVSVISRPIEDKILDVVKSGYSYATASFGVSYESDRSYLLWTVSKEADTTATQCFRFNTFTNTWVRWPINKTCGVVNSLDDKLYLGAGDDNFIERERKSRSKTDYADREFSLTISANGVTDNALTVSSTANAAIGDDLSQVQYLTISQFNRLLKRLDADNQLTDGNYFSTLGVSAGDNITTALQSLATKLDAEAGTAASYAALITGSTDFATVQSEFNDLIDALNGDSGVFYSDYRYSTGTVEYDSNITATNSNTGIITVSENLPFLQGPATIYKAIQSEIIWLPNDMGDPTILKQIREGTILFEDNNFSSATIGYGTDRSPGYSEVTFTGFGAGDFGQFSWGEHFWGGISAALPVRTLVPLEKQRCRFIMTKFKHKWAREKYAIYGVSLVGRATSTRAYR